MQAVATHAGALSGIPLGELEDRAGLLTRTERKYVVDEEHLGGILGRLDGSLQALDIDGCRRFGYESVYFDTPQLDSYRAAARGMRRRFKVRTRTYLDSGRCFLEVKVKNGRGQTVKRRIDHPIELRDHLTADARAFVAEHVTSPDTIDDLAPVLTTRYLRTTLVGDALRVTIDTGVSCVRWDGAAVSFAGLAIVETKSTGRPSPVDRELWSCGDRPISCSKYAVGLAALDPSLPRNKWHAVLSRLSPSLVVTPRSIP